MIAKILSPLIGLLFLASYALAANFTMVGSVPSPAAKYLTLEANILKINTSMKFIPLAAAPSQCDEGPGVVYFSLIEDQLISCDPFDASDPLGLWSHEGGRVFLKDPSEKVIIRGSASPEGDVTVHGSFVASAGISPTTPITLTGGGIAALMFHADKDGAISAGNNNALPDSLRNVNIASVRFGQDTSVFAKYSTVAGGVGNTIDVLSESSFIGSGDQNSLTNAIDAAVVSGRNNQVLNGFSSIVGGNNNAVHSSHSFIGGGLDNVIQASGGTSVIGGGGLNEIVTGNAFIGGGVDNHIIDNGVDPMSGLYSAILGGSVNTASGEHSVIIGGGNTVHGNFSDAIGMNNNISLTAWYSIALGKLNTISGGESIAIGKGHTISGANSFAIGTGANVTDDNTLAIAGVNVAIGRNDARAALDVNNGEIAFGTNRYAVGGYTPLDIRGAIIDDTGSIKDNYGISSASRTAKGVYNITFPPYTRPPMVQAIAHTDVNPEITVTISNLNESSVTASFYHTGMGGPEDTEFTLTVMGEVNPTAPPL